MYGTNNTSPTVNTPRPDAPLACIVDTLRNRPPVTRIVIILIVVTCGAGLLGAGQDLSTVLLTMLGLTFAGATVARWVLDGIPLPPPGALLALASSLRGGAA
jgi:type IV secretory pathway VirB2 component (pilin)